jgi:phosphatidate cytidylyltransferase
MASSSAPSKAQVFVTRLTSTLLLWCLMGYAVWAGNDKLFFGLSALFGLGTAVEYFRLMAAGQAFSKLGIGVSTLYWCFLWCRGGDWGLGLDVAVLVLTLQASFMLTYLRPLEGERSLLRVFSTVGGVFYSTVCFGFLLRIADLGCERHSFDKVFLLLFCIMVTKFTDMGAYAIGSLLGKNKMIPHISPAKSWEGFAGAFAGGFLAAAAMLAWVPEKLAPLTWWSGLLIVPVLVVVTVSGDLAESVLKRCVAIKDSGHTLPGIGGVLDLTDSLLFTAPVFYAYLLLL